MRVGVVVTAAGSGQRLGLQVPIPKALVTVGGRSLLQHAVDRASSVADVLVVTAPEGYVSVFRAEAEAARSRRDGERRVPLVVVAGGESRQDSVRAGIAALGDVDYVLVHDAARAFTPESVFASVVQALREGHPAVIPAVPVVDTIKRADSAMRVTGTVDRSELWAVQTPQGFSADVLANAHALGTKAAATDDAALVENLGVPVQLIAGHEDAFKVTTRNDLEIAHALMAEVQFTDGEHAGEAFASGLRVEWDEGAND